MRCIEYLEGRRHAILMLSSVAYGSPDESALIDRLVKNLKNTAERRPAAYAAGIKSVLVMVEAYKKEK